MTKKTVTTTLVWNIENKRICCYLYVEKLLNQNQSNWKLAVGETSPSISAPSHTSKSWRRYLIGTYGKNSLKSYYLPSPYHKVYCRVFANSAEIFSCKMIRIFFWRINFSQSKDFCISLVLLYHNHRWEKRKKNTLKLLDSSTTALTRKRT